MTTAALGLRSAERNGLLRVAGSAGVPRRVPSASYSCAPRVPSLYNQRGVEFPQARRAVVHSYYTASPGSSEGVLLLSMMSEYRAK